LTLKEALAEARRRLDEAGIPEAALESEILLRHALGISTVDIYLRYEEPLEPQQQDAYFQLIDRRLAGEPSAYITGQREFYGLPFYVNHSVLIPRPETELLVGKALERAKSMASPVIADIGTGSGIIAIIMALRLPQARIFADDISPEALETARRNSMRHGVEDRITFVQGDLLSALPEKADIVASNLPYVKSSEMPDSGEPRLALDGGQQGLDVISRLCRELPSKLKPGGSALLEIGMGQAAAVSGMLREALPAAAIETYYDLAGIKRLVVATA
jgi:release factor glutamine methyltransferase